ncbi:MAG: choice-of-anchor F family protein [Pseudomonadota bacterium]
MSMKKRHSPAVFAVSSLVLAIGLAQATSIESWNRDNVVTDLPNWPPGVEPSHVPGVTYDSKLYTGRERLESHGAVIWKEGSVVTPGAQVLTESPDVGRNCIITTGTNRADPNSAPKTCTDEFQSAKRVKLEALVAGAGAIPADPLDGIVLTDGKPLDMVFNASDVDDLARAYRVFKKYINATGQRMAGFVVELGFGTGSEFIPSSDGDGLRFSKRQKGQNPKIQDFNPLPFYSTPPGDSDLGSLMSAGLFGDAADNKNRTIDGYFGLPDGVLPWTNPTCNPDPSGTGRAYYDLLVQNEDRIETAGNVQGLHYCLFGNMLPQGQLPLGFFWDGDGDPVTDADTIADWDGSGNSPACGGMPCWETYVVLDTDSTSATYGDPVLDGNGNFTRPDNPPVAVPQQVIDFWVANPEPEVPDGSQFYFITELDDMGLVNNNYHITVESIDGWPTYDPASGAATFTLRSSNLGEGQAFAAPWLASLPPEMAPEPLASDVAITLDMADAVDEGTEVPVGVAVSTATGQPAASGQIFGEATDPDTGKAVASLFGVFADLMEGTSLPFAFNWLVTDPTGLPDRVIWTARAIVDGGDPEMGDNQAEAEVVINAAPTPVDVSLDSLEVPRNVKSGETEAIKVVILNSEEALEAASGTVTVEADGDLMILDFADLQAGEAREFTFDWTAPTVTRREDVAWLARVSAAGDSDPTNDVASATTRVTPAR